MDCSNHSERYGVFNLFVMCEVTLALVDMVISVKEYTVFSLFHPDAHDLFNTCSDLKKVAYQLWNPEVRLNDEVGL